MKRIFILTTVLTLAAVTAQADVFNLDAGLTNLEMVTVGDPGNAADNRYASPGYGSVGYTYNIGKYEVTAAQYCDFLNHKAQRDTYDLYNTAMADTRDNIWGCNIQRSGSRGSYTYSVAADWANKPVNYVSYWDACRFVNWLCNGQGNGDTETGAYTLRGQTGYDGRSIKRNPGWSWAVTSEDEWYKAAYYKGGGTDAGYWDYPTQSNTDPSNLLDNPTGSSNSATYLDTSYTIGSPYYRTDVGAHENSNSAYGTFDQGGNVYEWNESIVRQDVTYASRCLRGGSFERNASCLQASARIDSVPADSYRIGFRVVQAVPEPSSILALLSGIAGLGSIILRNKPA